MVSVSETTLPFGEVQTGTSETQSFAVSNAGAGTLVGTVTLSSATSPFMIVSGASFSLGASESQVVEIAVTPNAEQTFTVDALVVSGSGSGTVAASATGVNPVLSVNQTTTAFGSVAIGDTADDSVTVSNVGSGTLVVAAATSGSSEFALTTGASYSLAAGESAPVTVRFTPAVPGESTGSLGLTAGGVTTGVGLSGQVPQLLVTPASFDFGQVAVGVVATQDFVLINTGAGTLGGTVALQSDGSLSNAPFTILGTGAYSLVGNGASATVTVQFSPTQAVQSTDGLLFTGGGGGSVSVAGTGGSVPVATVSASSLSFGEQQVATSVQQTFTVENTGSGTLTGTATLGTGAPYTIVSDGSYSLTNGQSQPVLVEFTPTTEVAFADTITCTGGANPATVSVSGTGVNPVLSVGGTLLDFGAVVVGATGDGSVSIGNTGTGTLVVTAVTSGAPFGLVTAATHSLAAGASDAVTVRFTPTAAGTNTGSLTLTVGGVDTSVTLRGDVPELTVTPGSLSFGQVAVTDTAELSVTVENTGRGRSAVWRRCSATGRPRTPPMRSWERTRTAWSGMGRRRRSRSGSRRRRRW